MKDLKNKSITTVVAELDRLDTTELITAKAGLTQRLTILKSALKWTLAIVVGIATGLIGLLSSMITGDIAIGLALSSVMIVGTIVLIILAAICVKLLLVLSKNEAALGATQEFLIVKSNSNNG